MELRSGDMIIMPQYNGSCFTCCQHSFLLNPAATVAFDRSFLIESCFGYSIG